MTRNGQAVRWGIAMLVAVSLAGCSSVVTGTAEPLPVGGGPAPSAAASATAPSTTAPSTTAPSTAAPSTAAAPPTSTTSPRPPTPATSGTTRAEPHTGESTTSSSTTEPGPGEPSVSGPLLKGRLENEMRKLTSFRVTFLVDATDESPEFQMICDVQRTGKIPGIRLKGVVEGIDIDAILLEDEIFISAFDGDYLRLTAKTAGDQLAQFTQLNGIRKALTRSGLSYTAILSGIDELTDAGADTVGKVKAHKYTFQTYPGAGDLSGIAPMNEEIATLIKSMRSLKKRAVPTEIWSDGKGRLIQQRQVLDDGKTKRVIRVLYGEFDKPTGIAAPDPSEVANG